MTFSVLIDRCQDHHDKFWTIFFISKKKNCEPMNSSSSAQLSQPLVASYLLPVITDLPVLNSSYQ